MLNSYEICVPAFHYGALEASVLLGKRCMKKANFKGTQKSVSSLRKCVYWPGFHDFPQLLFYQDFLPLSPSLVHLLAPAPTAESLAGDPREVMRVSSYFPTSQLLGQLPLCSPQIPVEYIFRLQLLSKFIQY